MLQLIYASAAVTPLSVEAVRELLLRARHKNAARGITGMLLYHGGSFLQVLEGPAEAVDAVFRTINADNRHGNIRLLYRDEITAPEFGDWSMGFVDAAGVSRVLAGFADDGTAVPVLTSRRTRAKKVLALFQEGAYRQLVDR
jgi:hypothetical protein